MSKLHETARNFLNQWSSLTEFATTLVAEGYDEEKSKNLKSEIALLENSLQQKKYQVDQITIAMSAHKVQLEQVQKDITRKFDEADAKAELIIKDAKSDAEIILSKAKERVMNIKSQAATEQDEASKRIAELNNEITTLTGEASNLRYELAALKKKFA